LFESTMLGAGFKARVDFKEESILSERNIPLYLHHIAINRMEPLEEVYQREYCDKSFTYIKHIVRSYIDFKMFYDVYDFNDLLQKLYEALKDGSIQPLDVGTVFVDEAQDFTKLQWETVKLLFKNSSDMYVAADDDQALYEWAGVDVKYFLTLSYDTKTVLVQSHRLPEQILTFSKRILKHIENRFEKDTLPKKEPGEVRRLLSIDNLRITKNESWLFLVRNIFFGIPAKESLMQKGVPFLYFGKNYIDQKDIDAIYVWELYRSGKEELTDKKINLLKNYMDVETLYDKSKEWYKAFLYLDVDKARYYRKVLMAGFSLREKPRIEITTIHRSKGREADNVVLFPDQTYTTAELSQYNEDAEHRVWYVAATRTKKVLYIVEPESSTYYEEILR